MISSSPSGSDNSVLTEAPAHHLDLLVNNAGIYPEDDGGVERLELRKLVEAFDVNALGALRVTRAMLPLLRKGSGKRRRSSKPTKGAV